MWLMPSYGRPDALRKLLEAPGGWPDAVTVLVNSDDPTYRDYIEENHSIFASRWRSPWLIFLVPSGLRFAEAVRAGYQANPNEPFYGIIDDDYWPVTPDWHDKMVAAAGPNAIAIANNLQNFPKPYCCRVMGGELARAIGTIAPGTMRHNFTDDAWGRFAEDFHLLRPLEDVIVEHRHHLFTPEVKVDATYERGSGDFAEDKRRYAEWLNSEERRGQCERVAKLLGGHFTTTDWSKVSLALLTPIQDHQVDLAFHHSYHNTQRHFLGRGVSLATYETAGGSHVGKARERVLWNGMKSGRDHTHFLFIDSDMGWTPEMISRLVAADVDFAACAGVRKQDEVSFCLNLFPDPQELHPVNRFLKVRHVGGAFVLIKRAVIERMCAAYPELQYDTGDEPPEWALFFDMMWKREGRKLPERLSEDFSFCQRWLDIGGDIWVDPQSPLIHVGRKEFTGRLADMLHEAPAEAATSDR